MVVGGRGGKEYGGWGGKPREVRTVLVRCHLDNLYDASLSKYANVSVTHFKMFYLSGQSFCVGNVASRLIVHVHTDWTPGAKDLSKSQKPYPFSKYVTCSD